MRALIAAVLLAPAVSFGASLESIKGPSDDLYFNVPRELARPPKLPPRTLERPDVKALDEAAAAGRSVGRVRLALLLDRHRDLINRTLGAKPWDISVAGDAAFKNYFLTFARENRLVIAPVGDPNKLRGEGVTVTVEPGVVYNFRVEVNIFDPVRGSTVKISPASGTRGPSHRLSTGSVLDRVKTEAYVFSASGAEFWLLHGTDVDPATNTLAATRSLLFIRENGLSTKAWPISESALEADKPYAVSLGDVRLVLTRTSQGELLINEAK